MDNPWRLSNGQQFALQALTECAGSVKAAAAELGIAESTVDAHCSRAKQKMGARTRFEAVLLWDRWVRGKQG